jgi:hypothetical protein
MNDVAWETNVHGQGLRGTTRLIHYAFFPLSFLSLSLSSLLSTAATLEDWRPRPDTTGPTTDALSLPAPGTVPMPSPSWHRLELKKKLSFFS